MCGGFSSSLVFFFSTYSGNYGKLKFLKRWVSGLEYTIDVPRLVVRTAGLLQVTVYIGWSTMWV